MLCATRGAAIFRATEHMQRLLDSAKVYRIDVDYSRDQLVKAMLETVAGNGTWPCYVRPIIFRGYGEAGVTALNTPTEVYIINYPFGYLGGESEARQRLRIFLDADRAQYVAGHGQVGRRFMNSQLIKMEANVNGFAEGIALDVNGFVSEGSGVNVFVVHREKLITAPLGNSVLPGITRYSVLQIASDLGITIVEQMIPREMLYIADEAFFTGTAAEVTPIRSVDKINVGKGTIGPITKAIQKEFYAIVRGEKSDRHGWLTPVPVRSKQPVEEKSTHSGMRMVRSKPDHSDLESTEVVLRKPNRGASEAQRDQAHASTPSRRHQKPRSRQTEPICRL